jgi:hypothetical protein
VPILADTCILNRWQTLSWIDWKFLIEINCCSLRQSRDDFTAAAAPYRKPKTADRARAILHLLVMFVADIT